MRTVRLSLAGTVMLLMVAGLASVAAGQDEEGAPTTPVYVTGQWGSEDVSDIDYERWFEGTVEHRRVAGVSETWEWSDPRLPGEWSVVLNQQFQDVPDMGQVMAWTFTSTEAPGPNGEWAVDARGVVYPDGDGFSVVTLTGQGGYDGLYAVLDCGTVRVPEDGSEPPACEGYILKGAPPALPAEPLAKMTSEMPAEEPLEEPPAEDVAPETTGQPVATETQDEAMAPALVTGTETCTGGEVETTQMEGYALMHASGPAGHCTVTASDPRVSGPSTEVDMRDACFLMGPDDPPFYPSGCIYWGGYGIDGPDGSWVGTWTGVDDPGLGKASYLILLEGTGAYEGWSFVAHWLDPFTGEPLTFSGLIYQGPLPPWELPTE